MRLMALLVLTMLGNQHMSGGVDARVSDNPL